MTTDKRRTTLTFDDDPGARRSLWIAILALVLIVGWMGSGFVLPTEDAASAAASSERFEPVSVAVRGLQAEPVTLTFEAEGQAQPDRDTALRAEASGDVIALFVEKGEEAEMGEVVARLSTARSEADLTRAEEELDRARRDFENASQLLERGVSTADRVAQTRAALAAAEAQVVSANEALEAADIVAPFAGRIETLSLDEGEFISAGAEVGRIVDNRPLTVAIQVPQQALGRLQNGQMADVHFITGETAQGEVTFVGTAAATETRTFLVEIEVPNADSAIPAGISAEILIPTGEALAHFIPSSIVSLSPNGEIGVKTVEADHVVFHPVDVVRVDIDGVWVTGLPERADVITIGQGFVRDGERVRPLLEDAIDPANDPASDAPTVEARQ